MSRWIKGIVLITLETVFLPVVVLGFIWGLIEISFRAGVNLSDDLIDKLT